MTTRSRTPRTPNPHGKMVKPENAHEVYVSSDGWIYYVLKKYQKPEQEAKNPYARWYCCVVSPMTSKRGEYGDTYVNEIKANAVKVDYNPLKAQ